MQGMRILGHVKSDATQGNCIRRLLRPRGSCSQRQRVIEKLRAFKHHVRKGGELTRSAATPKEAFRLITCKWLKGVVTGVTCWR